ncbi:hypothetical protein CEXT_204431, partial [Caerostris extrusa]
FAGVIKRSLLVNEVLGNGAMAMEILKIFQQVLLGKKNSLTGSLAENRLEEDSSTFLPHLVFID